MNTNDTDIAQQNFANPWNGLRTYTEGEIIYGRAAEIQVLSQLILQSNQTVVYGRSGIGKSSILNAGIFPVMRRHNVFPVYVRFEHNVDESYLHQIKGAIRREIDARHGQIVPLRLVEKTGNETLWEFFHRMSYLTPGGEQLKPMIVFDQFEEIFTLESNREKVTHFFRELADLINNVMPESLSAANAVPDTKAGVPKSDGSDMLDLGLDMFKLATYSYSTESNYHLVFTLREDFLAYLERNTTGIPALKNNRYCLQSINDEQAAEIIMEPRPGLVSKDVAKLIIQKVTGETSFEIDGIPEIQVDSAILSLYLSRIYEKMQADGQNHITAELVETYSDNIIEDFYSDAIRGLPDKGVAWLENSLINDAGRRDNRDKYTVLHESSLTETQLNRLIDQDKLLRQFSYGGGLRVEYIHDIIVPIALRHKHNREVLVRQNRLKKRTLILSGFIILLLIAIVVLLFSNSGDAEKSEIYTITLQEDSTINLNEYWKAELIVTDHGDTLLRTLLDKTVPTVSFETTKELQLLPKINVNFLVGSLKADSISLSPENGQQIKIVLSQLMKRKAISGTVMSTVGSRAPICDALIIIDDQVVKSNYRGEFRIYVDETYSDNIIRIIRNGYQLYEGKLNPRKIYRLRYNDDYTFYKKAKDVEKMLDSIPDRIVLSGRINSIINGDTLGGNARMELAVVGDSIIGYMYYLKSFQRESNKYNSYFMINGSIDPSDNTFRMNLTDAVDNHSQYVGVIKDNKWQADAFYKKDKISFFSLSQIPVTLQEATE